MIKIEIKTLWGSVLFSHEKENNTIKDTLIEAVKKGADLEGANLEGAYLEGANLKGADLEGAYLEGANLKGADLEGAYLEGGYLEGANLEGANLEGANLEGAYLEGADLEGAYLEGANLEGAYLEGADLEGAYLEGANLEGAYLEGANLKGANLSPIKNDMFSVLITAIPEIPNLKLAIKEGRIDGSVYEGECACLNGTLSKCTNKTIVDRLIKVRDFYRPIERFFLAINEGDTPENSQFSKLALEWIEEFESYLNVPA